MGFYIMAGIMGFIPLFCITFALIDGRKNKKWDKDHPDHPMLMGVPLL
jgi:hypothetical protein